MCPNSLDKRSEELNTRANVRDQRSKNEDLNITVNKHVLDHEASQLKNTNNDTMQEYAAIRVDQCEDFNISAANVQTRERATEQKDLNIRENNLEIRLQYSTVQDTTGYSQVSNTAANEQNTNKQKEHENPAVDELNVHSQLSGNQPNVRKEAGLTTTSSTPRGNTDNQSRHHDVVINVSDPEDNQAHIRVSGNDKAAASGSREVVHEPKVVYVRNCVEKEQRPSERQLCSQSGGKTRGQREVFSVSLGCLVS